ncbi:TPA: STM0539 family protein [Klebsiella aerogenes]|uniref:STM0539 family protein n=1 Tax=Klebsiella aerogenes TaxID=548 RepID=UPI0027F433AF|nr:STM0539 family protein [Klebsiella aerogenes]MEB5697340.1 STM0539 family protein [Klebsiella aerogenes]HDT6508675.1 STM0539 family protein [Klebsiella aerogenes]
MRKTTILAAALLAISSIAHADERTTAVYALSSGIASIGSSALVSGIILSPVMVPVALITASVDKNKKQKTALLTTKDPKQNTVKMVLPLQVVEEADLKAGDKLTLEKAPEGTGALLKKEDKVLAHMVNQEDASLSANQPLSAK